MIARLLIGDVRDRLAELPDGSVDLIVTSPPFLALRSYLPADHPDKHREIGSEPDPATFLDTMLALTAEWRRVLTPHGSICVELGDTYAGSGGAGGDYNDGGLRDGQERFDGSNQRMRQSPPGSGAGGNMRFTVDGKGGVNWPLPKSLCLIPSLYPVCLAYGRNPLTGRESPAGQWRIRNLIVWGRPNPPVGALGDKFRPATSLITVACVSDRRWFDLDAVRTTPSTTSHYSTGGIAAVDNGSRMGRRFDGMDAPAAGAPPLDWHIDDPDGWHIWPIPTHPYKGAHYATFPPELPKRLIEAMCPREVCTTCGEPRRRIVAPSDRYAQYLGAGWGDHSGPVNGKTAEGKARTAAMRRDGGSTNEGMRAENVTLGWTDCGHGTWRPGHVLDPFAGSGTTLAVATGCGRDATGIDLDPRNAELAAERCGMFLEVDHPTQENAS